MAPDTWFLLASGSSSCTRSSGHRGVSNVGGIERKIGSAMGGNARESLNAKQCRHAKVLWWSHRSWISKNSMKLKRFTTGINSLIMAAADKVTMLLAGSEALATKGKLQLVIIKNGSKKDRICRKFQSCSLPKTVSHFPLLILVPQLTPGR